MDLEFHRYVRPTEKPQLTDANGRRRGGEGLHPESQGLACECLGTPPNYGRVHPPLNWVNYIALTRPHPKWWFMWGIAPQAPYFRLVKHYNSPRLKERRSHQQVRTVPKSQLPGAEAAAFRGHAAMLPAHVFGKETG